MKTYKIIAFSFLFGSLANAQTLEDAIKKTDNERYAAARTVFNALIAKEPTKADNYFYFGENYFKNDELDSANMMWSKGASVDPLNALNVVGLGKYYWYKGDTTKARVQFAKAVTMTKNKNAEVIRKTAEVLTYAPIKRLDEAIRLLDLAVKLDAKNPESYLILGDALLEKTPTNGSPAIEKYNLALNLNPKSSKSIVRTAKRSSYRIK
jgi:tetratricopeptide (TPR) repeat protein